MLMVQGVDRGCGLRARMEADAFFCVSVCELSPGSGNRVRWCCRIEGQSAKTAEGYLLDQSIATEPALFFYPKKYTKKGQDCPRVKYNESAATVVPCCTARIICDHFII